MERNAIELVTHTVAIVDENTATVKLTDLVCTVTGFVTCMESPVLTNSI